MTAQELIDRLHRYRKAVAPRGLAAIAIMMLRPVCHPEPSAAQ